MDIETRVFELYKQVQKLQDRIDELENQQELNSNDTENLISEEVHWIIKVLKKIFCYR
jgi:DNA anti-recombination protein RmuC